MKSVAERSLEFASLFEAEVLVRLMLWRWDHPLADDEEFANGLLEGAAEALAEAVAGAQLIGEVPARDLSFVAAVWYAEQCSIGEGGAEGGALEGRTAWLSAMRKAMPSCFCNPTDLDQP